MMNAIMNLPAGKGKCSIHNSKLEK